MDRKGTGEGGWTGEGRERWVTYDGEERDGEGLLMEDGQERDGKGTSV